jgi:hypothetical protein
MLELARDQAVRAGNLYVETQVYASLIRLGSASPEFEPRIRYASSGLDIADRYGFHVEATEIHLSLCELALRKEAFESALAHFEKARIYLHSIDRYWVRKEFTAMQARLVDLTASG